VDDEPGQRFIGSKSLKRLGYEVAEVEDGRQALAHFEKANEAGTESPYDLLVMDMIMEEGFDGLDTYEAILKLYPNQKVIIASGHAEDGRARAAGGLGADWLAKPYHRDDLAWAVRKRLNRHCQV
jgi:CheY-like chemotaxis protein